MPMFLFTTFDPLSPQVQKGPHLQKILHNFEQHFPAQQFSLKVIANNTSSVLQSILEIVLTTLLLLLLLSITNIN